MEGPKISEASIQESFFIWLFYRYRGVYDVCFHIPNGGTRTPSEGAKMKKQGLKPGMPDVMLAVGNAEFNGLFIEFKTVTGVLSQVQKEKIDALRLQGYRCEVCRSLGEAMDVVNSYMESTDAKQFTSTRADYSTGARQDSCLFRGRRRAPRRNARA